MDWSPQQETALQEIEDWLRRPPTMGEQVRKLFGYAGTGKSTLAKEVNAMVGGNALACAYTGKAASVMARKGLPGACTVHSLIYTPAGDGKQRVRELEAELALLEKVQDKSMGLAKRMAAVRRSLDEARSNAGPQFLLKEESLVSGAPLVILDECFVRGTLVDCPDGPKAIETIEVGQEIYNATGVDIVRATLRRPADVIVRIVCGETTHHVSPAHPFFTGRGFVSASDLRPGDRLVSTEEAVRLLRHGVQSTALEEQILHEQLLDALVDEFSGAPRKDIHTGARREVRPGTQEASCFRIAVGVSRDRTHSQIKSHADAGSTREDQSDAQTNGSPASNYRGQRSTDTGTSASASRDPGRGLVVGTCCENRPAADEGGSSHAFQARHSKSGVVYLDRVRRLFPLFPLGKGSGQTEDRLLGRTRVDSVEVLKPGDTRLDQFREADGLVYLYDLQATRHSSFSVSGCLVHNCSMVSERMAEDLLSFGVRLLVLGDPAQLPPVKGTGYFTQGQPHNMLTEVHRQARDNPIIRLATDVREGRGLRLGEYGTSRVVERVGAQDALAHDQVLCGTNKKRRAINLRHRELEGRTSPLPEAGERLICLKNDRQLGLLNGTFWRVQRDVAEADGSGRVFLEIAPDEGGVPMGVPAQAQPFADDSVEGDWRDGCQRFTWSGAITVHKSQGSEFGSVLLFSDWTNQESWRAWHYTGLTRASDRVTVVLS